MEANLRPRPHSVKRWQLDGTDYEPKQVHSLRLSSWTPLHDKSTNLQLFEERVNLVLHWFDLWTDQQRKHLLHSVLARCSRPQLKFCRDLLNEAVPVTQVDFTAVLPRFLSLYVMSFLSPRDLSRAAQVSWHWRVLSEQDCIWAKRCIRKGWFLPYTPAEKEFGAWKNHYVSCVSTLDYLTPKEAAETYGTLTHSSLGRAEDEEERREERRTRQSIRDKLQEEKRLSLRTRQPWGSNSLPQRLRGGGIKSLTITPGAECPSLFSWCTRSADSSGLCLSQDTEAPTIPNLSNVRAAPVKGELLSFTHKPSLSEQATLGHQTPSCALLLISNRVPAYEMVLSGVKAGVAVVLYDHRGTLSALLAQVERTLRRHSVQRLGLLVPGGTQEIHLLYNCSLSETALLTSDHQDFWEKVCAWVAPTEGGGGIDVFCPLAASASGGALIRSLSTLTGLRVRAPMGLATGSFQNILSEWSDGNLHTGLSGVSLTAPALHYVCEGVLQAWCTQVHWMVDALEKLKLTLGSQLQQFSLQARGRALGHFLWEEIGLDTLRVSKDLSEALVEGLAALRRQDEGNAIKGLSVFLTQWRKSREDTAEEGKMTNTGKEASSAVAGGPSRGQLQTSLDWKGAVVRELHQSELLYVSRLSSVLKAYQEPLTAAFNSHKTILSFNDIQIVLMPVSKILELNKAFVADLGTRLFRWSAERCVGDVFLKLCSNLKVYTNYLHNYTTAIQTIDKCRESKPEFRAFLKRTDRTLTTHMLSLQELLLCPVLRVEEYVRLLQALAVHTPVSHPDHTHIRSALSTMLSLTEYIQKLNRSMGNETLLDETQNMIHGCPNLHEGNRQLITTQDAALLRSPDEHVPDSLRSFEHVSDVGLFLFTDALVLTRRHVRHTPFAPTHRSTHTFLASVDLAGLCVREVNYSRYVRHAFVLEGPRRSWVCATETEEEREHFLCVLRSAIQSALKGLH